MSTTIPYDPSLTLGNIVPQDHIDVLEQISGLQTPIDNALLELNSAILLKRKLLMTMQELVNLKVDTSDIAKNMENVDKEISTAATNYADISIKNLPEIAKSRANIPQVSGSIESPIDYNKSNIKQLPLASDSLTMDAQYFSFDENKQGSENTMATLKSFVSASTEMLGSDRSAQMTAAATEQTNQQREHHDLEGTLVITANCTIKMADIFAPFIIDVDKGIRAWNEIFPDNMIKTNDPAVMAQIAEQQQTKEAKFFNLLSGATYGASFVGMVHVLRQSDTQTSQDLMSVAAGLQGQMEIAGWFTNAKGGFGIDTNFSDQIMRLLSTQEISSHVSLVCMGVIPTIQANDVQIAVKTFDDFSPDKTMEQLATLQNMTSSEQDSVTDAAKNARTGAEMMAMQSSKVQSVMQAVGEIDDGKNKMLDVNSLMTAFTDFVNKAIEGNVGVPINYYLKPITAAQLAQMWVAKYYPGKFVTSAGDDSKPAEPQASTSQTSQPTQKTKSRPSKSSS